MRRTQVDPELADVCRQEHARLVGLLALDVGDRGMAEDLAWQALVRLHERWPRIPSGSHHAWVSGAALDLARSGWRRRYAALRARWRPRSGHAEVSGPPTAEPRAPAEPAEARAVRSAVAALPASQRAALVLRYHAELSLDEAAGVLRCPPETVQSLVHSAVNALRLTFEDLDETVDLELRPMADLPSSPGRRARGADAPELRRDG